MKKLHAVLCAVDFSETSVMALEHAMLFARRDDAAVHVIHVDPPLFVPMIEGGVVGAAEMEQRIREGHERALREIVARHRDRSVPVESHLAAGFAARTIVDEAERLSCDLIVLGTTGRSGLPRFLLGSVAESVVRTSPIDVLTVPSAVSAPRSITKILCAVDFSPGSEDALDAARSIAARHEAALHVVHAWETDPYLERSPDVARRHEQDLTRRLDDWSARRAPGATRHVRRGAPYAAVVALASEIGADLIVASSSRKSTLDRVLLGSVAERIVRASPVPVLTVRRVTPDER